jgi:hypothetical protein
MESCSNINRRKFISQTASTGVGISIIPSYVLGKKGKTAPNDKINVALIGSGTQALKQLPDWLNREEFQFVSVCDPNKESYNYPLWGRSKGETKGAPGGREIGRKSINEFYAEKTGKGSYDGCTAYADFREQLEQEKDLDAIFIMTPDHLHGAIALAGMRKNLSVATHKPIANFMNETRLICNTARRGLVCRLARLRFSTITRRSLGRATRTRPRLPRSFPASTCTRSPFSTFILVAMIESGGGWVRGPRVRG